MAVYKITDALLGVTFDCPSDTYLLDAAETAGLHWPYSSRAGVDWSSAAILVSGQVDQTDQSFLTDEQMNANFILTDASYPLSDCVVRPNAETLLDDGLWNKDGYEERKLFILDPITITAETPYPKNFANDFAINFWDPFDALYHYVFGNGQPVSKPLEETNLDLNPCEVPEIANLVNEGTAGTFQIDTEFNYNTLSDSISTALYLGNITLRTEGNLIIDTDGAWSYDGVVRAYEDTYDANRSTHRNLLEELSTIILGMIDGTDYQISLPGELPVKGSGTKGSCSVK